jgi:hypothetical protein
MSRVLYEQNDFPILQNRVYETFGQASNCPRGDIRIIEDKHTGLIYNDLFDSELIQYDSNYNNEQGISPFFRQHLSQVKEILLRNLGNKDLVEVGCGKGRFLEILLADGFEITGFDPTYEGNNPRVVKEYFKPGVLKPSRGLVLRHVLEHVPNPYNFLSDLRDANGGSGLIYIEVPCFDWICNNRAWFDVFYEHVNYFRMTDFFKMFSRIQSSGKLFGDQYLYVVADLKSLTKPTYQRKDAILFPDNFLESLFSSEQVTNTGNGIAWGGASKGVIFSLLRERIGKPIRAVVDVNPAKQEKFLPVTGLKVLSVEEVISQFPVDTMVYVMNSNYLDEIRMMSKNRFHYRLVD